MTHSGFSPVDRHDQELLLLPSLRECADGSLGILLRDEKTLTQCEYSKTVVSITG
jgi:hypothetical protein